MLLILGLFGLGLAIGSYCPPSCDCNGPSISCCQIPQTTLTRFPKDIPDGTKTLLLRNCFIDHLAFDWILESPGLLNLTTIIITRSSVRSIDPNILDKFPNLKRLSFANNQINFIPPLASKQHGLVSLDFRHNQIERIHTEAFSSIPDLIQLDLAHNKIQSFPQMLFKKVKKLNTTKFHRNPYNCDCRISMIIDYILKGNDEHPVTCFNPPEVRGKALVEVQNSVPDVCEEPYIREIDKTHHELTCPGEKKKNVQWFYRKLELDFSDAPTYQVDDNGRLILPLDEDASLYTCASDFSAIPVRSHRQVRTNTGGQGPSFTYQPRDSSYREGTAVKIHCEVVGEPKPTISWYFKQQKLYPSRKYELTYGGSVLKIYPFLEEDVGSYRCEAINIYGRIEATARLQLISSVPPSIYDGPATQSVEIGQQVTFRCRARGIPKPDISWFFDGSIIPHIRGRFMVSEDGTELTVTRVGRQDDGVFSCMAGNSVGAMMAEARLKVKGDFAKNVDEVLTDDAIKQIARQAKDNVEREVTNTRTRLSQGGTTDPSDLKKLFRFSIPAHAVELTKAREIYEESIRLVNEHVSHGLRLPVDRLTPNVSYEAVLSVSHIQTLMELSGCQTGQVLKDSCSNMCFHSKYRTYDGQCNNMEHPMWGVASMPLSRLLPPIYENGFNTPIGWEKGRLYNGYPKPNARDVSRQLIGTETITPHSHLSAMVMQWGQFIDHDLTHTATALARSSYATGAICNRTCENLDPCFNIPLSPNDPKLHTGINVKYPCIEFERSGAVCGSGETSLVFQRVTYRDQLNIITSYLDGSVIYGSSEAQALELRELYGDHGLLRFDVFSSISNKAMLPFEKDSDMDCKRNFSQSNPIRCFLAGDLRANEQLGLTAMHTLFLREHNRIASKLLELNLNWDGETIYQETRKIVAAQIQHVTYNEWLPTVLGKSGYNELIGEYKGYNPEVNPSIANAFATAAFRFGHTLINPTLFRLDKDFKVIPEGHIPLHKAFFEPARLLSEGGVDPLIRGLFASPLKQPKSNQLLNMELTEKLFPRFHDVALDLAVMNIQRGRDHGLPGYTEYRRFCNLSVPNSWDEMAKIVPDAGVRQKLKGLYGHPANIDLWVGAIVEPHLPDALTGPTFACIIADQFKRLRDGDRFWYENDGVFTKLQLAQIKKASLARLFCDNGDAIEKVQKNVFFYPGNNTLLYQKCEMHSSINLAVWSQCCDSMCSSGGSEASRRRRRAHADDDKEESQDCSTSTGTKKHGTSWHPTSCSICKCDNSKVWCSVKEGCKDEERL